MAKQEIGRLVAGEAAAFGHRNGGRIHHHQPQQQQGKSGPQQEAVELGGRLMHRSGEGATHACCSSAFTAAVNTSPRCG